jgi:GTPase SAR1 family protein
MIFFNIKSTSLFRVSDEDDFDVELKIATLNGGSDVEFISKADCILIIYDITKASSFKNVMSENEKSWKNLISLFSQEKVLKVLVGNKIDGEEKRSVNFQEVEAFAKEMKALSFEVSAKDEVMIQQLFKKIVKEIIKRNH